ATASFSTPRCPSSGRSTTDRSSPHPKADRTRASVGPPTGRRPSAKAPGRWSTTRPTTSSTAPAGAVGRGRFPPLADGAAGATLLDVAPDAAVVVVVDDVPVFAVAGGGHGLHARPESAGVTG